MLPSARRLPFRVQSGILTASRGCTCKDIPAKMSQHKPIGRCRQDHSMRNWILKSPASIFVTRHQSQGSALQPFSVPLPSSVPAVLIALHEVGASSLPALMVQTVASARAGLHAMPLKRTRERVVGSRLRQAWLRRCPVTQCLCDVHH